MTCSVYCYRSRCADKDEQLKQRLLKHAQTYPRYGYLMLHGLLKRERLMVNKKRTYCLYTQAKLQLRTKRRKKLYHPRCIMPTPATVNKRLSMDFMHD
ncbi:MAG: transposase [Chromatiales bacterium]|nr:transposase [Chromatiales bacterium]